MYHKINSLAPKLSSWLIFVLSSMNFINRFSIGKNQLDEHLKYITIPLSLLMFLTFLPASLQTIAYI